MVKVDATPCADAFHSEIKAAVDEVVQAGGSPPKLVGFLANDDKGAVMYARWTERTARKDGIVFELRRVERVDLEDAVIAANEDPSVHGIIVYYPVFGGPIDDYLRDVISVEKDVEGLNHRYRYSLYHNIRELGGEFGSRKCILPCTPLAVVKLLEFLGAYDKASPVGEQLAGREVMVYNRSEVVGRPLAAMLANDGATVYSVDVTGILTYRKGRIPGTIKVEECTLSTAEALETADIVVAGVPVESFQVEADKLKPGAIAVNFSQFMNFSEGTEERAGSFVPAIGKVTIAMLLRNLLRLYHNYSNYTSPTAPTAETGQ